MQPKILNLFKIKVVSEVCKTNSYKTAANNLHITPSAVSKIIKSLEDEWNLQLVRSTGNSIKVTGDALKLLDAVTDLLHANDRLVCQLSDINSQHVAPYVKFGSGGSHTKIITTRLLAFILPSFPNLEFEVTANNSAEVLKAVENGELDCGIVSGILPENLDKHFIFEDKISLYAFREHPLVGTPALLKELNFPICFREKGSSTRTSVEHFLSEQQIQLQQIKQTGKNDELTDHLCRTQNAMQFLSDFYYQKSHWKNEYVKIACQELLITIPVFFVTRKKFPFTKLKTYIQQLPFQQEILAT